jgi:hypothetical protein
MLSLAHSAAAEVSRSCACIGSPCLRYCGHGASIGPGAGAPEHTGKCCAPAAAPGTDGGAAVADYTARCLSLAVEHQRSTPVGPTTAHIESPCLGNCAHGDLLFNGETPELGAFCGCQSLHRQLKRKQHQLGVARSRTQGRQVRAHARALGRRA